MVWTAFLLGLAGSLHCVGMCGPLVLAAGSTCGRAHRGVGLLAYHAGRLVTYAAWGLVLGVLGRSLALAGAQRWVSVGVGVALLASLGAPRSGLLSRRTLPGVAALKRFWAGTLRSPSVRSQGLLGLLNGLLPCGLVYAAAGTAATLGNGWEAVRYMVVFGLGTVPMLAALVVFGATLPFALRLRLQRLTPVALGLVAVLLIVRGLGLGIPFLSPALGDGAGRCH